MINPFSFRSTSFNCQKNSLIRLALSAIVILGLTAVCMGGTAKLDPVYLRFDQLTANYECSVEHSNDGVYIHDEKIEILRNGIVVRTDTADVTATPFNFIDSGLDGVSTYTYKLYQKSTHIATGTIQEDSSVYDLFSLTASPRYVWGTLPEDDTIDGYMAEGIDFALNIPVGKTLTLNNSAVNSNGQIDVYGAISLNNVELYGTINVMGSISVSNVTSPSQSARGEIWLNAPVSISGSLDGVLVRLNAAATGSSISGCKGLQVNASISASFSDNTDLTVVLLSTAKNISINGGTVKDIYICNPESAGSSVSVSNAQINGVIKGDSDMSDWKIGGHLIFTNCVINSSLNMISPTYPDDTQFKDCKFRSGSTIYGGRPKFTSCHFAKLITLSGRTKAVFDGDTFREAINLTSNETGADNPPWAEASDIFPTIENNSFVGLSAIQYEGGATGVQYPAAPIEIGANYYGDRSGPGVANSFLADLGSAVSIYSRDSQHTTIFAFPDGHSGTGESWRDDEVFPAFWLTGYVVGQNSILHVADAGLRTQGKETLLSVQIGCSHSFIQNYKVKVEFDGMEVPEFRGKTVLNRDIGDYGADEVAEGNATFDFILPATSTNPANLKIWTDDTNVTHDDILKEKIGEVLVVDTNLAFRPPPTRALKLMLRPVAVLGYTTPSAAQFREELEYYFPALLGIRRQDIQYIIRETDPMLLGSYTGKFGLVKAAVWQAMLRQVRLALSNFGIGESEDFTVSIFPTQFGYNTYGSDGANISNFRGTLFCDADKPEGVIHEFGHAGPELYTDVEQYYITDPDYGRTNGMPVRAATIFKNETVDSGPFSAGNVLLHLPGDLNNYSWTTSRRCIDIMGGEPRETTWIDYSSLVALTEYIYALAPAKAKAARKKADTIPAGQKRILLWGFSEKDPTDPSQHRLVKGSIRAFNITEIQSAMISPGSANGNQVIAYGPKGEQLFTGSFAILENGIVPTQNDFYWTGTYDIPENAVRLVINDKNGTVFDIQSCSKITNEVTSPKAGDTVSDSIKFEWKVNSWSSGQPVQNILLISADGGTTWHSPVFIEENSYDARTDGIPVSDTLAFKLISTDGLRSAVVEGAGIILGPRTPVARIISPRDGDSSEPGFAWTLEGNSFDEDDDLDGLAKWNSSKDGDLGTGDVLRNVILSAGQHVLTYSVSDKKKNTGKAQITLNVAAEPLGSVDLKLDATALHIVVPGKGPLPSGWTYLEKGQTHTASMFFRNTGTKVNAILTLALTPPGGAEAVLATRTVELQPFAEFSINSDFLPDADGEYIFSGKVEAVNPTESDESNNEQTWSRYVKSQASIDFTVTGAGTVTASPAGSGGGAGTLGAFEIGTEVFLTAVPADGSVFTGWSGDLAGTQKNTRLVMNRDMTVAAEFKTGYSVTVNSGEGSGSYLEGQTVTVSAEPPSAEQVFNKWTGNTSVLSDTSSPSCTFNMPASNVSLTATYKDISAVTHTITAAAGLNGLITPPGTVTVNDGASQSFAISADASYHVADVLVDTVSKGEVTSYTFTNVTENHTISATFAINTGAYSISGTVSGAATQGVTLTLSGTGSSTNTSAADGTFNFAGRSNGSYTVTPSLSGYTFTPSSRNITVSGKNVTGCDFVATKNPGIYSISGTVSGAIHEGVTIALSGEFSSTTVSAADGSYSFTGLADGSCTVTPELSDYTFTPYSRDVSITGADQTGMDFTATAISIYGQILKSSFNSSYKDSIKKINGSHVQYSTDKFTVQATIQFPETFDLKAIGENSGLTFDFGLYSFSDTLKNAFKKKLDGEKGGSASFKIDGKDEIKGKTVTVEKVELKWDKKKKLTVKITGTPASNSNTNVVDLSGKADNPLITGNIDTFVLTFNNAGASFESLDYTGKKTTKTVIKDKGKPSEKTFTLVNWSTKGKK